MTTIGATVTWECGGANFLDNRYSRAHRWSFDGGAEVAASSSPEIVPLPMSDPTAVDPEEAFVASLASCHMLWFLSLAARRGWKCNRYRDQPLGEMGKREDGKLVLLTVRLRPQIAWEAPHPSAESIAELHHAAQEECFLANSVRTEIIIVSSAD